MWNRHLYPTVVWAFGIPWNCCRKQMHLIFKSSATMWVTPTQKAPTVRAHALSQLCSFFSLSTESGSLCYAHSAHALSEICSLSLSLSEHSFLGELFSWAFGSLCCAQLDSLPQLDLLPQRVRWCVCQSVCVHLCLCVYTGLGLPQRGNVSKRVAASLKSVNNPYVVY